MLVILGTSCCARSRELSEHRGHESQLEHEAALVRLVPVLGEVLLLCLQASPVSVVLAAVVVGITSTSTSISTSTNLVVSASVSIY